MSAGDGHREPALGPADYARACVDQLVRRRPAPPAPDHPLYARRAACFVTLKKHGELRGCIGTLAPSELSLGREIARNARSAAFDDPRFPPVHPDELEAVTCSVDVLSPSEPCAYADLDPSRYGVIVRSGWRRGVLLPDLQGVDTPAVQVRIAAQKAGIEPGEPCELERFTVTRCREGESADAVLARLDDHGPSAPGEVDD
jgi:AmmeMemoRadiSam system protein A